MTRLVLFDLDGTLLLTGGVGQASTKAAMERVFGSSGQLERFYPGGRTIEAILVDTLAEAGFSLADIAAQREAFYAEYLAEFERRVASGQHNIRACRGGPELVGALLGRPDVLLGLLTGNHSTSARIKLEAAGYRMDWFQLGAYGHESAVRSELVGLAQERALAMFANGAAPFDTVVIGDTARDVASAKAAGARCIAVATGTDSWDMLTQAGPDHLFADLADTAVVLAAVENRTERIGGMNG